MKNNSELIFENILDGKGLRWEKIPETNEPRPDYHVWLEGSEIIIEIKQLELTKNEKAYLNCQEEFPPDFQTNRIRKVIADAYIQIKYARHTPSILAIIDNRMESSLLDPENILNAMYGSETAIISKGERIISKVTFGHGRKVSPQKNRLLSGLFIVYRSPNYSNYEIVFFHNIFSINPISPEKLYKLADYQYIIENDNKYQQWIRINPKNYDY